MMATNKQNTVANILNSSRYIPVSSRKNLHFSAPPKLNYRVRIDKRYKINGDVAKDTT